MKVVAWKAFYTEGRIFDGKSVKDFRGLPDDGVLVIVLYYDRKRPDGHPYRDILDGHNWYFCAPSEKGTMYMCDNSPKEDIALRYPKAVIKRGKGVDRDAFDIVDSLAMKSVECPDCS